jgi:hypothetical protein
MHQRYCRAGSAWSCNELGILASSARVTVDDDARELFRVACAGRLFAACENATAMARGERPTTRDDPRLSDYVLVLQGGRGPIADTTPLDIYTRACGQGFVAGCGGVGDTYFQGLDVPKDQSRASGIWRDACARGHAMSCSNLGVMYHGGDGVPADNAKAVEFMRRACELGNTNACRLVAELKTDGS